VGGQQTHYINFGGSIIAEKNGTTGGWTNYIYFNGKRVARRDPNGSVHYYLGDHLGSTSMVVSAAGAIENESEFYPFGGEMQYSQLDSANHYKFTGKERDQETGLDDFGARHYASTMGRFIQPDPIFFQESMLTDPQRFNLYAYVRNNPLTLVDPSGESIELTGDEEQRKKQLQAAQSAVGAKAGSYLYENKVESTDKNGNKTTRYFVGVYTNGPDGKGPAFGSINSASEALGNIISDSRVAQVNLVSAGTTVRDNEGNSAVIGPIPNGPNAANTTPGATYMGQDGQLHVTLLDTSSTSPGQLPEDYMSNHKPGVVDAGILFGHEFGHVRYEWGGFWRHALDNSNDSAVRLENNVRQTRDPNAPTRTQH
jgi:RHS repeat-associated protein